jgi:type IV pilus assembly protein PilX
MSNVIHRQNGAALIVGLLILLVLTLLAIAGMNSASTGLLMAGNEQFQQRAFQAAETGVERTLSSTANFVASGAAPLLAIAGDVPNSQLDGGGNAVDTFLGTVRYITGVEVVVPGSTSNAVIGVPFEIVMAGRSARNANSTHTMGLYFLRMNPSNNTQVGNSP